MKKIRTQNKHIQVKFEPRMHSQKDLQAADIKMKNAIIDRHIPCTLEKLLKNQENKKRFYQNRG